MDLERIRRAARQELATNLLMDVDFVPVDPTARLIELKAAAPPPREVECEQRVSPSVLEPRPIRVAEVAKADLPAASLDATGRQALLDDLRRRHDTGCPHCTTATGHTRMVFGEGNPAAGLMFVGEAPGEDEDRTGRPFVGRAGQKLNEIIAAMKLRREDVYIANVLKTRPPGNRTPLPDEVARCSPYLFEQIRVIHPKVIVTLGGPATKLLLDTSEGITRIRGQWSRYTDGDLVIPVMPTFHPAYLLRNYTQDTRRKIWNDMKLVIEVLDR